MRVHPWLLLLLVGCGADVIQDHKTCVVGEDEPGMPCDVEGQTCGFADGECSYSSTCENGQWSQGTTVCNQGGSNQGGQGQGGEPAGPSGCPLELPANDTTCLGLNGLVCTYGDSLTPQCRTVLTCTAVPTGEVWGVTPPDRDLCAGVGCPGAPPPSASECTVDGLTCGFEDGLLCTCTTCTGGPCGPPPPQWVCGSPQAGCPDVLPNAGTSCAGAEGSCDYGNPCAGGQATSCNPATGAWEWVSVPCPL